jgi:hypothetical protein
MNSVGIATKQSIDECAIHVPGAIREAAQNAKDWGIGN